MSLPNPKKPRYLTKSRFKIAQECPTKLAYTGKPGYGNTKNDDPFLRALAEGGFQVGALAKLYIPGGTEVETSHNRCRNHQRRNSRQCFRFAACRN